MALLGVRNLLVFGEGEEKKEGRREGGGGEGTFFSSRWWLRSGPDLGRSSRNLLLQTVWSVKKWTLGGKKKLHSIKRFRTDST